MRFQDYIIAATEEAKRDAFKNARAVPDDKLDWKPSDTARSVLSQCRELAMCPGWALDIISQEQLPEWNDETIAAIQKEEQQWKTVDDCEAECDRRLAKLYDLFRSISDERLKDTKWLPYDGGRDFTVQEMMEYPRWNFTYHLGQICYIQMLYGDKEMH